MLTRTLFLSLIWLLLAFALMLAFGTRLRRGGPLSSLLYLALLVGAGDALALNTFADPGEAGAASLAALLLGAIFLIRLDDWNALGQAFFMFACTTTALYLVYAFAVTAFSPLSPLAFMLGLFLYALETSALLLALSYAFEMIDVLCRIRWRRVPQPRPPGGYAPFVSLHVPAYSEPPEVMAQTLRALKQLDYPRFEVIVVDNNTPDETQWQPLSALCKQLGFKFMHLERWPGYKSGALNFALSLTDPQAEIVGVIDADYIVQPDYLRALVPYFAEPELAFVQTPQDYRDFQGDYFQAAYDSYKYFFAVSMPARNERNAIIFGGTMGLLRKRVLEEIGGWDEWCITEDAEASLRILMRSYSSLYINRSFGRGLMPLNFEGLKKQRFRWAFGGVQILKKHWGELMPWSHWLNPDNHLSGSQRYFYLLGGLQWFNEPLTFMFTLVVLTGALLALAGHAGSLRPVTETLLVVPPVFIFVGMLRALWALRASLHLTWKRAALALLLMFSLTWVVTLACWEALVRDRGMFLRTPKTGGRSERLGALSLTGWETAVGALTIVAGLLVLLSAPSWYALALMIFALSQAAIYLSAPFHSLLSVQTEAGRRAMRRGTIDPRGYYAFENRIGLLAAAAALLLFAFGLSAVLQAPLAQAPGYASLKPPDILPAQVFTPVARPLIRLATATPVHVATPTAVAPTRAAATRTPAPASTSTSAPPRTPPATGTSAPASTSTDFPSPSPAANVTSAAVSTSTSTPSHTPPAAGTPPAVPPTNTLMPAPSATATP